MFNHKHFFVRYCLPALLVVYAISAADQPDTTPIENAGITVHAGGRQVFHGFGAGQSLWDAQQGYAALPDSIRDTLSRFLYADLNFRYLRLRSTISECGDTADNCASSVYNSYRLLVQDARKHQPRLTVLLSPQGEIGDDLAGYARRYARQIKALRDSGVVIHATGIANEPDWEDYLSAQQVPQLIRHFRAQLDSAGLADVKIVAPENSSADYKAQAFVDSIIADPQALSALDAFATHSYNWSITEEMNRRVESYVLSNQKQYWTTEASEFGTEKWEDAKEASSALSRVYADMNHLCNVWMFYVGIKGVETDWRMGGNQNTAFYMILYRTVEKDWGYLLKCWYFKQASRTFEPGAQLRKSTTNLKQLNAKKYWRAEDSTMVYAFGRKAPLYLAAAVNPDGSWGAGVTNFTGDVMTTPLTSAFTATTYTVTVFIEELADSGDIVFTTSRCNATPPYIHREADVTMHAGVLTIDSLRSFEMITLRSPPGTMASRRPTPLPAAARQTVPRLRVAAPGPAATLAVEFTVLDIPGRIAVPARITAFDGRGRRISEIFSGRLPPGAHRIIWTPPAHASGVLLIRLESATGQDHAKVVIAE